MPPLFSKEAIVDWSELVASKFDSSGKIIRNEIKEILPYGDEFLFVDWAQGLTDNQIVGYYQVKKTNPTINAHFVHSPIMPGCLVAESFAQGGTILIRYHLTPSLPKDILVGSIEKAKFILPVKPGDILQHKVKLTNLNTKLGLARLEGSSYVQNERVATFKLVLVIIDQLPSYVPSA